MYLLFAQMSIYISLIYIEKQQDLHLEFGFLCSKKELNVNTSMGFLVDQGKERKRIEGVFFFFLLKLIAQNSVFRLQVSN